MVRTELNALIDRYVFSVYEYDENEEYPDYTSSIENAELLVKELPDCTFSIKYDDNKLAWVAKFASTIQPLDETRQDNTFTAMSDSKPRAICIAALRASTLRKNFFLTPFEMNIQKKGLSVDVFNDDDIKDDFTIDELIEAARRKSSEQTKSLAGHEEAEMILSNIRYYEMGSKGQYPTSWVEFAQEYKKEELTTDEEYKLYLRLKERFEPVEMILNIQKDSIKSQSIDYKMDLPILRD